MAKLSKPTKQVDITQTSGNLAKSSDDPAVSMNFKVPQSFRTKFKKRAAEENRSMTDILIEAFDLYLKK